MHRIPLICCTRNRKDLKRRWVIPSLILLAEEKAEKGMTWSADNSVHLSLPVFEMFAPPRAAPPQVHSPFSQPLPEVFFVPSSKTFLNLYLKGYPRHPSSPYFRTSKMARTGFVAVACAALAASASALTVVTPSADLNVVADR